MEVDSLNNLNDKDFVTQTKERIRSGVTLFPKDDVVRLHNLANHPLHDIESLELTHYRLPKDFAVELVNRVKDKK